MCLHEKRKDHMKIFICDDEEKMVEDLASIIQDKMQGRVEESDIFTFVSSPKLWQALQTKPCDVLFLDIDMPQMSGLDIAQKLSEVSHKPLVVFVTSYDELSVSYTCCGSGHVSDSIPFLAVQLKVLQEFGKLIS